MFTEEMRKELSRTPVNTRSKAKHNNYMEGKEVNTLDNEKNAKDEWKDDGQINKDPTKDDKSAESTIRSSKSMKHRDTFQRNGKVERRTRKKNNKDSPKSCISPLNKEHNIPLASPVNEKKVPASPTSRSIKKKIKISTKRIVKDESATNTASISIVTPQSSPIMINPSPHRSVKTPKKSPVSLASPKARSVAPMRVSKTPRKLNLAVKTTEGGWNEMSTWYKTLHNTPVKAKKDSTSFTDLTRSVRKFSKSPKIVLRSPKTKLKASRLPKSRMSGSTLMSNAKSIKQRKIIAKQNTSRSSTRKSLSKSLLTNTQHETPKKTEDTFNKPVVVLDRHPMLDRLASSTNINKHTIQLRVLANQDDFSNCTQLTPKSSYYTKRVPELIINHMEADSTTENLMPQKKHMFVDCVVVIPDMGNLTNPLMSSTPVEKNKDLKSSAAKKMPNFSEIHKKMFAKSESLTDAKKRIQARHATLFGSKVSLTPAKSNQRIPLPNEKNGTYNHVGYKIRMKDAVNIVSRKQPYDLRMKRQEQNRQILKGVRTNRRFELQMKSHRFANVTENYRMSKHLEMNVVTISLEALIQRVTNPQNQKPDIPATEAFCVMLSKEAEGIQIGTKLLASYVQSSHEYEALQALTLLDTCMHRCGPSFHAEVGKFRFLNEMIRLVSPKYLGNKTPSAVRQKVLQLLYAWTKEYPRETKIKEAYEMLKKQGVVEEDAVSIIRDTDKSLKTSKAKKIVFEDEEKSKLLQKLLQSKNPDDLLAANRLIKTMVKEDERRVQQTSRRIMELEAVHNNAKLLSDMLDSYNRNETSAEDLELTKELYQACERLKPTLLRLANEAQDNEDMLDDVLAASDELGQVFVKYAAVIVLGDSVEASKTDLNNDLSLLDLSPSTENMSDTDLCKTEKTSSSNLQSDMEVLGDIFNSLGKSLEASPVSKANVLLPDSTIMQPISILPTNKKDENVALLEEKVDSKTKALEELNELGENLLRQSLSKAMSTTHSHQGNNQAASNVPKVQTVSENYSSATFSNAIFNDKSQTTALSILDTRNGDAKDTENKKESGDSDVCISNNAECEIKSLTDINVNLEDIKPGTRSPITVMEEKNGLSVILHFAQDSPREDVSVLVITTMSKNKKPLSNYLFQAVVPKKCKCRLQPPSGTELPAHNPFLPPSAITQIMLIANPNKESVSLKFMLSYTIDNETYTEMGEVDHLLDQ
ncbi:hypothetical protein KM043_002048 [Ampulex compressa]|nr:hypothetical protein KM043_002048 [Ampulex compressa]